MLSYVKPSKMTAKIQDLEIVNARDAWAAAAYAQRINGEYLKPERSGYKTVGELDDRIANKFLMQDTMFHDRGLLTEEDYLHGEAARDHHSKKMMMATFKRDLSDFERTLSRAVGMECFTKTDKYEIAVIASQIASYERDMREQKMLDSVGEQMGYVADVGSRVEFTATVIRKNYAQMYNTYRIVAVTQDGYRIQFYYRHDDVRSGDTVRFKGTVKKHLDNTTYFNRVTKAK